MSGWRGGQTYRDSWKFTNEEFGYFDGVIGMDRYLFFNQIFKNLNGLMI